MTSFASLQESNLISLILYILRQSPKISFDFSGTFCARPQELVFILVAHPVPVAKNQFLFQ
jgi:hypothetical protein